MEQIKEEKKEGNHNSVLLSIETVEKGISKAKSEFLSELSRKDEDYKEFLLKTREYLDKLKEEHNEKISRKDKEIQELKDSVKKLVNEYELSLKEKDETIKLVREKKNEESVNLDKLKPLDIPKEIILLPKEDILLKLSEVIKENFLLSRKNKDLSQELIQKEKDSAASKGIIEKSFESLTTELSDMSQKNKELESSLKILNDKITELSLNNSALKQSYDTNIEEIKKSYEQRINEIISSKAREAVDAEVTINLLLKQIEEYKTEYLESEARKEAFLKDVEERIKKSVLSEASIILKNNKDVKLQVKPLSKIEEISRLINNFINKGETNDTIISKLNEKGYSKTDIVNAFKLVR